MNRLPALIISALAAGTLVGCHLIFTYEDNPPDGGVLDGPVKVDQKAPRKDGPVNKDTRPPDQKVVNKDSRPPDQKVIADKKLIVPDKKLWPTDQKVVALDQKVVPLDQKVPPKDIGATWSWKPMTSGTTLDLYGVWGLSSKDVRATGSGGIIMQYKGASWSIAKKFNGLHFRGVWGMSNIFHHVGHNGGTNYPVWLVEQGPNYTPRTDSATARALNAVYGTGPTSIIAVGEKTLIKKITGVGWSTYGVTTIIGQADLNAVYTDKAGKTTIVGDSGATMLLVNGTYVSASKITGNHKLTGVWPNPNGGLFITSESGLIYQYDSSTYIAKVALSYPTIKWTGIHGSSAGVLHVVGYSGNEGRILPFANKKWGVIQPIKSANSSPIKFKGVWVADDGYAFAVGEGGVIYRYGP